MRRIRGVLVLLNVLMVVLVLIGTTSSTSAGTLVVFREDYRKTQSGPVSSTDKFNVTNPGAGYTLRVFNGGVHGLSTHVSSAVVSLNGKQILSPGDFTGNADYIERAVRLESRNTIIVELRGSIGSFLAITIDDQGVESNSDKHENNGKGQDKDKHDDNRDGDKHDGNGNGNGNGNGGTGSGNGSDTVPPSIHGAVSPAPNSNGWNNSDVTVTFTCIDTSSGIASCSGPVVVSTNGANQVVTGTAVDSAGNTATTTVSVNLDKASPSITATAAPAANANGWNGTDVTISFVCSDALSGIASCPGPTTVSTSGANQTVTGTVVDNAGNTAMATASVNLDKTLPSIVATVTPAANANGWNNTNVTVSFTCSDALSGTVSCPGPTTLSNNGANQSVSGTTTDKAGNTATASVTVNLDKTSPSIVATATPAPNASGWNNADVTVTFTCSDALSGMGDCPAPTTLSTSGGNQAVTGTATDQAGNTATATATVNLDKDSPSIVATATPAANANGWNNANVTISFTCSDALSGTNNCPGPTTLSTNGANQSVAGTTTDKAGNTASTTATVNLDKDSPSIVASASPAANANGWNNSDVTITFTCSDAFSGTDTCSGPTTLTTNGANQTVTGTTADKAGNTASTTTHVNLDKSSPTIAATATPAPNANGWNNSDVTVTFTCGDGLSGIVNCTSPVTVTTPGALLNANGTATDRAGNTANTTVTINLDKAGPILSLWPSASTVPTADFILNGSAPDGLSGLVRVTCNGINATISDSDFSCALILSEGPNTIQVVAFDSAGNSSTTSTTINFIAFVPPSFGPAAVSWINVSGVTASGNSLTKTNSTAAWNSGADSSQVLPDGYGFVEFTATETNTARMGGLGSIDSNQDYTDVDYGILLRNDATMAVYESGAYRGEFGNYAANDRLRIEVRYGVVRYFRNGQLFLTSAAPMRYPLRVDTSLFTAGATLTDVRVGSFVWTDGSGVLISGESLIKTGNAGWNAGAISTNTIESGNGFMEFTSSETNTSRIGGLGNLVTGVAVSDVQFGIMLNNTGVVEVMEGGTPRGSFGPYAPGDRFRIEVNLGVVRYYRNNVLLYTSLQAPSYPLRADCAFDTPGGTLTDVTLKPFNWVGTQQVYADGGLLIKKTLDGWATASSMGPNIQSGDGYIEFTAIETNRRRGLGLKSGGAAATFDDIDYLVSLNENGTIEVIEFGTSRANVGSYQNGDRFRVEIQNGIARYRRNGVLLYTSATSPAYPLHGEAALYSRDATLVDLDMGDLVFTNAVNARTAGHALVKFGPVVAWDAGAASTRTTTSGYMEFTASEGSTARIAGLSNGDSNQDYIDIDFAILLRANTTVAIYEAGTFRGDYGNYVAGDRFRVEVQAGTVRYFRNGTLLYTSTSHPMSPLRVDTSLQTLNSSLFNIIFR